MISYKRRTLEEFEEELKTRIIEAQIQSNPNYNGEGLGPNISNMLKYMAALLYSQQDEYEKLVGQIKLEIGETK